MTVGTIFLIALIFFVFNLVLALSFASQSVITKVGEKIDISAELLPGVEDYVIQELLSALRRKPEVKEVVYVGSEEALRRLGGKYPQVIAFLEQNNLKNPLPASVRLVSFNVADNGKIMAALADSEYARVIDQEKLFKNQEQKLRHERTLEVTRFLKRTGLLLNTVLALTSMLILFNSLSLLIHAHRKEIAVMKLVGARSGFIWTGFLAEGVLLALASLFLSFLLAEGVLKSFSRNLIGVIQNESLLVGLNAILVHFEDRWLFTLGWQTLGAVLLGLAASALALRLTLKKTLSFSA